MKQNTKDYIIKLFWIFIIASIIGCAVETIVCIVQKGHFEIRQGVIYGPFIPVYGAGAVLFYIFVPLITGATAENAKEISNIKIFLNTMVLGGITEYLFSYGQEKLFGTISWDYSNMFFNLNGRTCLLYCFYWGIIAVAFLKVVYPGLQKLEPLLHRKSIKILTVFLMIFMIFDISISSMAAARQTDRRKGIEPRNNVEVFLDKTYPDEYLDRIYNNKKNID